MTVTGAGPVDVVADHDDLVAIDVISAGFDSHHDLTESVAAALAALRRSSGLAKVMAVGSTCGLTIMRYEPGAIADLLGLLERVAPVHAEYEHEHTTQDPNGASHLRSTLVGTSVIVPFRDGQLLMSAAHRVVLFDFDLQPATRHVWVGL